MSHIGHVQLQQFDLGVHLVMLGLSGVLLLRQLASGNLQRLASVLRS